MISYEEALTILHRAEPLGVLKLPLQETCGYILAQAITSKVQVPPFANSAMDGFAVRADDLVNASPANPVTLSIAGSTVAGDIPSAGEFGAWEIMTGAPVPKGYDAVVKIEDITRESHAAKFTASVPLGNNIRNAGEDFSIGDKVASVGTLLNSYHIMTLATLGEKEVEVTRKPKLTLFSTGKELVEDADAELLPGQIRNSNAPYLMSACTEMGLTPHYGGMIADEPEVFEARVQVAQSESDIIISTGAVSAGKHDFIPDSLRKLGAEILFHKVAIRPGKPILYARFPDGTHYFGLPGNPISAAVGFRFFVVPLLRRLQGMVPEEAITARLLMPSAKKKGLRFFRKVNVSVAAGGKLQMEILKGQESFKIQPMLNANGWASFSPEHNTSEIGQAIDVYPLLPNKWALEGVSWGK